MFEYTLKILVHVTHLLFLTSFTFKSFQTNRYLEDLHFDFLVAFHTVFPELHLKVTMFVHRVRVPLVDRVYLYLD